MTNIPLFPRPLSWLSAVLLYVFLGLWMTFVATVAPRLYELFETAPRLAALGFLGVWVSPIAFVGAFHHVTHAWPFDNRARGGIHTLSWVLIAAQLYDLERAVKERAKRGEL